MQVRPVTPGDVERIHACHSAAIRTLGADAHDERPVRAWVGNEDPPPDYPVDDPDHRFVVAWRDGEVAGVGDLGMSERELTAVYVHPDHAGEGVATALLAHPEGRAVEAGLEELHLSASLNAVGFYERTGYERAEETTHETEVGVELPVVKMRKSLAGRS